MTDRSALAWSRLAVITVLIGLVLILACRPAWSPDGKRLLFHTLTAPRQIGVALYDRDTGKTSLLTTEPVKDNLAAMAWSPDSKTALVLTRAKKGDTLLATAYAMPTAEKQRTFEIAVKDNAVDPFVMPPVVIGHHLFVYAEGILRLDLESGDVVRHEAKAGHDLCVMRRGDGLCYLSIPKSDEDPGWELGTLDPETFAMTPLVHAPPDGKWRPLPVPTFSPKLDRIAIPAQQHGSKQAQAILVFADGKLETTLPLGADDDTVGIGSVHWASDGVTLLVSLCRRDPSEKIDSWTLYETTISGSVERETTMVRTRRVKDDEAPGMMFPMALSPDGKTAAFSTAMLEFAAEEDHGLYLLDLSSPDRTTTRVPFPERKD